MTFAQYLKEEYVLLNLNLEKYDLPKDTMLEVGKIIKQKDNPLGEIIEISQNFEDVKQYDKEQTFTQDVIKKLEQKTEKEKSELYYVIVKDDKENRLILPIIKKL